MKYFIINRDMREKLKLQATAFAHWCRSNVIIIVLLIFLIIAGVWSLSYAYLGIRTKKPGASPADTVSASGNRKDLAETVATSSGETHDDGHQATPGDSHGSSALGAAVDCEALEREAQAALEKVKNKLVPDTEEKVKEYNAMMGPAYEAYEHGLTSKGCSPRWSLNDVLAETGTNPANPPVDLPIGG